MPLTGTPLHDRLILLSVRELFCLCTLTREKENKDVVGQGKEGPTVDALAPRADEGRGMAAKSLGELPSERSRGCPNGETPWVLNAQDRRRWHPAGGTRGTETSQYPEEEKATAIPLVVASERGTAQTLMAEWSGGLCHQGVVRHGMRGPRPRTGESNRLPSRRDLGRTATESESLVGERDSAPARDLEYHGARETLWEAGGTTLQG